MSSGTPTGRMYLIDAHSLIFQVFHAIPEMSSPSGLPTNALFGFTKDMLALRDLRPDYLVVAFDVSGPTFREELYSDYKAHRSPMPDDLVAQIPLIYQMLEAMRLPVLGIEGFEADDVIATVSRVASERGCEVFVCTSDKDCRQLIDDRVKLLNLRKNKVLDRSALMEDWAITPEQVVDLQALVGDPVDNVPGVPGIGLKTAAKLLQEFGTLDQLLTVAAAEPEPATKGKKEKKVSLTPRLLGNLRESRDKVLLSRKLVRLDTNVPLTFDWEGWRLDEWDGPRLLELFQQWDFKGFANRVRSQLLQQPQTVQPTTVQQPKAFQQGELFPSENGTAAPAYEAPARKDTWVGEYHTVDTSAKFADFLKQLKQQKRFAIDLETTSLEPRRAEIVGLSFCWKAEEGYYLPLLGPAEDAKLDPATTLKQLKPLLEDPKIAKVNQNIKYDQIVLRQQGIELAGVAGDSMVAHYLLNAGARSHNMDDLSTNELGHIPIPITSLIGKGKKQLRMDQVPVAKVAEYAAEDADVAWRLCAKLEPELRENELYKLYKELEVPLIDVLAEMEFNGIRLDVPLLERIGGDMAVQLKTIESDIYDLAGHPFNIASLKQLRTVLFDELKLSAKKKTSITGEPSTDQETLELLAGEHELPRKIVEHRKIAKLKGTYVDALPALVNPQTGRVHASFNQTVAATGRLSSSDPNLQNIPVRTEQGREIRQAFVPEPGWVLLTADYSQIELRLLAHFTGDAALRQAFAEDRDIHAAVAAQIYGVPEKDVTSEMRRTAKTVNFGVIYGISAFGLAARLGITKEEAAQFIDAYFARYPLVQKYQDDLLRKCIANRYVGTILGRRREISGIREDSTYHQRNQPEREAINMEIQGSAADLIKVAMLNLHRRLKAEKRAARMLLQIHDELVFETPPTELKVVAKMVEEEMTGALTLDVPLKVDLAAGPNWLDVEEL